jgi:hypothetical protein
MACFDDLIQPFLLVHELFKEIQLLIMLLKKFPKQITVRELFGYVCDFRGKLDFVIQPTQ